MLQCFAGGICKGSELCNRPKQVLTFHCSSFLKSFWGETGGSKHLLLHPLKRAMMIPLEPCVSKSCGHWHEMRPSKISIHHHQTINSLYRSQAHLTSPACWRLPGIAESLQQLALAPGSSWGHGIGVTHQNVPEMFPQESPMVFLMFKDVPQLPFSLPILCIYI